ncbi:MAG: exosortase U [Verrucomicrobiaceae bacterium]|nr:exosortase U [Verrucomicrobiaceae bacterium]
MTSASSSRSPAGLLAWASPVACLAFALHELWLRHPAYGFVPLPLLALGYLMFKDRSGLPSGGRVPVLAKVLIFAHFSLAIAGFVLVSPFFAGLAFAAAMTAYAAAHERRRDDDAPRWVFPALSLFFVPPPLMADHDLHQMLAGLAARLSQGWLDMINLLHVVEATIVVTPQRRFFVDDACSGTNSLLTIICIALVLSALRRRTVVHAMVLLAISAAMSVATNVLRICVVIGGAHFYGLELESGMPHQLLGIGFFALDLLLVWSADHGAGFLLNRASLPRLVTARQEADLIRSGSLLPVGLSLSVALTGGVLLAGPSLLVTRHSASAKQTLDASVQQFEMPAELAGWSRAGEQAGESSLIGKLGVRNQVWLYRRGTLEAHVAVNYPFTGFHDTRLCYVGQGWQFQKQTDIAPPGENGNTVRHLEMHQPADLLQAHLWLSVFDEQGAAQKFPSEDFVKRVSDRLVGRWLQPEQEAETTVVLQVLCIEPGDSKEAHEACAELLTAARQSLSRSLSTSSNPL